MMRDAGAGIVMGIGRLVPDCRIAEIDLSSRLWNRGNFEEESGMQAQEPKDFAASFVRLAEDAGQSLQKLAARSAR